MAQIVDYYSATAGGSSAMYYYQYADNTSTATRIYTGTPIQLPADYAARMVDTMYPLKSPSGWMHWYHIQDITPVYKTITDACTPPTSLSLNSQTKVLTITGGAGGDLNAWKGFGVGWRERKVNESTWGAWSTDTTVTTRTVSVTANAGMVRQYRVRTLGEAGSAYYSEYVLCSSLLNGNTAAGTPVILLPIAGASTCAGIAAFKVDCPKEPDGETMTLQRSVNGEAWTNVTTVASSGGVVYDTLALSIGTWTVKYRLMDASGASGSEDSITFTNAARNWPRTIEAGDVIASPTVSFVSDIRKMHELISLQRTFYGLSEMILPGTAGRFADVHKQLSAMQTAIDDCRVATGRAKYGFDEIKCFPTAQQITAIQLAVGQT